MDDLSFIAMKRFVDKCVDFSPPLVQQITLVLSSSKTVQNIHISNNMCSCLVHTVWLYPGVTVLLIFLSQSTVSKCVDPVLVSHLKQFVLLIPSAMI